ncbi:uncharacterized protein LOC126285157 [Schistocerca gregaria]|uniref:uncharacterized protein LOC126285157 n=1 Tax=Schistocerca gregaria TaxID=7010 RepID=UPI00211EAA5B|nr:uncharacterized protein LOC126285157 [Schistocerca gregaria]
MDAPAPVLIAHSLIGLAHCAHRAPVLQARYGSIAPRTALGKALTMGYAVLGIPLMLVYLSSVGALLSRCVRGALARTLCCCLCSNCGYCCYDEARMQEKERRMRKKRMQQMELIQQQQQQLEPFYVRSSSSVTAFTTSASSTHNNLHSPARDGDLVKGPHHDYGAGLDATLDGPTDARSGSSSPVQASQRAHCGSILAPVALCLLLMVCYICAGAAVLNRLEHWSFLDGSYFCFMSLSTIGFGDLLPGGYYTVASKNSAVPVTVHTTGGRDANGTIWFCSIYILTGMALTAMCFNILHDEIVHRLRHHMGQIAREAAAAVETLCSGGTPTSLFAPGADLVEAGSVAPPPLLLEQQLQQPAPVLGGVYTVREEDESQADTAEM